MMKKHADGSLQKEADAEKAAERTADAHGSQALNKPPPAPPPQKAAPPPGKMDGMGKGFLDGMNKLYKGQGSSEGGGGDPNGTFDAEFQKLMEAADPAFASQFKDPRAKHSTATGNQEEDIMTEALASLAQVIEPGSNASPGAGLDLSAVAAKAAKEKEERSRAEVRSSKLLHPPPPS